MINSSKTISKLERHDNCGMLFNINSEAIVSNATDEQRLVNDLLESQYYRYSTIP